MEDTLEKVGFSVHRLILLSNSFVLYKKKREKGKVF